MILFIITFAAAIPMNIIIKSFVHDGYVGNLNNIADLHLVSKRKANIYRINPAKDGTTYIQNTQDLSLITKLYTDLEYKVQGIHKIIPRAQKFSINLLGDNIYSIEINNDCLEHKRGRLYFKACEYNHNQKFVVLYIN